MPQTATKDLFLHGAKRNDSFCVPSLWLKKSTTRKAIEMGLTLSATTGATTARPPTLEVTETAGVKTPSAIVHEVANNAYRDEPHKELSKIRSGRWWKVDLPRSTAANELSRAMRRREAFL